MPKRNEGRDRILANVLIGLGIAVILAVIGACIYFSYEVASPLPPSSSEEERRGWLKLLSKQEFVIDKSTRNVKLEEFSFQAVEELELGRYYTEGSFLEPGLRRGVHGRGIAHLRPFGNPSATLA